MKFEIPDRIGWSHRVRYAVRVQSEIANRVTNRPALIIAKRQQSWIDLAYQRKTSQEWRAETRALFI